MSHKIFCGQREQFVRFSGNAGKLAQVVVPVALSTGGLEKSPPKTASARIISERIEFGASA
jgi:hypothetical protein